MHLNVIKYVQKKNMSTININLQIICVNIYIVTDNVEYWAI